MRALRSAVTGLVVATLAGCSGVAADGNCLNGEETCTVRSPCQALRFTCAAPTVEARALDANEAVVFATAGGKVRASEGDFLLSNGLVSAVISGPRNSGGRDLAGGALIDLLSRAGDQTWRPDRFDRLVQTSEGAFGGLVRYDRLRLVDEAPERVGLQASGRVEGREDLRVHTLYELRGCDRGVRIRTLIVNEGERPQPLQASDLLELPSSLRQFVATDGAGAAALAAFGDTQGSFAQVACTEPAVGITGAGTRRALGPSAALIGSRDFQIFERFLAVGDDVDSAQNVARQARATLFDEELRWVTGRITEADGRAPALSTVLLQETTGFVEVLIREDGSFRAAMPTQAARLRVYRLGTPQEPLIEIPDAAADTETDLGTLSLPSVARLNVNVSDPGGLTVPAELVFIPAGGPRALQHPVTGRRCEAIIGVQGEEPGCDRVAGATQLELLPGQYQVLAHHGPFWTVAMRDVTLVPGDQTLDVTLEPLSVRPSETVSAELHVHGSDEAPSGQDGEEARTLRAFEVDVAIQAPTGSTLTSLGPSIATLPSVEFAPERPSLRVPLRDASVTPGRFGIWPVRLSPGSPRGGLPRDDLFEPGAFFKQLLGLYGGVHVIQLQHPWLGRTSEAPDAEWLGFARAIGIDAREDLGLASSDSGNQIFRRTPANGAFANDAYHAQEVFSGVAGEELLAQRALWFYLLNQGVLRTGTASGVSHRDDDLPGVPRSLVAYSSTAEFDGDSFNESIRAGRVLGTNGPIIEAELVLPNGVRHPYGLQVRSGPPNANFQVRVVAAPWVPVAELRAVVNGVVVRTLPLTDPADPLGNAGTVRFDGTINLGELVTGITGDAWVVFEAGASLPLSGDLGGGPTGGADGIPDTTDNNGDGVVNASDVVGEDVGPLNPPREASEVPSIFQRLYRGAAPFAFTNPFILDRTANGRFDAPGVTGGRAP